MPCSDHSDAGRRLAVALKKYLDQRPVVLALPRRGLPVTAEVPTALHASLDLLLVRKIGVPFRPELAISAISDGRDPAIVHSEEVTRFAGARESEFVEICRRELAEVERRCNRGDRARGSAGHSPPSFVQARHRRTSRTDRCPRRPAGQCRRCRVSRGLS